MDPDQKTEQPKSRLHWLMLALLIVCWAALFLTGSVSAVSAGGLVVVSLLVIYLLLKHFRTSAASAAE
jgi:Flp pilus assembly protein TadB